ncbi:hypothetical protein MMB232_01342 [Brevundimonas subvibrioides]|uniref:Lipoprotein n=1 Tax=Brevundimonas subvibrioides (strain ATCC 15264 / DSM 4735 / LMG 14903 / NBRC 16000 / CB 81) TaxID=633149 RepID=D9QFT7_BRESC|nr:hypothetical protein [Brevundimonas subvibrioides]ADL00651.1 hypothetical protein Bresu_1339 [Brevundimonas subvibrioides ATCC 15264]
MKMIIGAVALSTLALAGCTDSKRARNAATWGDKPADITCWTYGTENFRGRSTGKVEYDDGGRVSFVDAANGRYTTVEGECRVVYLADDEDAATPAEVPSTVPPSPSADADEALPEKTPPAA